MPVIDTEALQGASETYPDLLKYRTQIMFGL